VTTDRSRAESEPGPATAGDDTGTGIDTSIPHSARIWNYWLGGKDYYEIDRAAGDQFSAIYPGIVDIARADRAFLGRVVRFLAGEAGVRQFLDVGTGLPTADNTRGRAAGCPGVTNCVCRQ
jgi:S-adenosyl methyltransferase